MTAYSISSSNGRSLHFWADDEDLYFAYQLADFKSQLAAYESMRDRHGLIRKHEETYIKDPTGFCDWKVTKWQAWSEQIQTGKSIEEIFGLIKQEEDTWFDKIHGSGNLRWNPRGTKSGRFKSRKSNIKEIEKLREYEIWSEGYQVTGQFSKAQFHGHFSGRSFQDAVKAFRGSLEDKYSRDCIDLKQLTFWGCKFYSNETDARRSFG